MNVQSGYDKKKIVLPYSKQEMKLFSYAKMLLMTSKQAEQ